MAVKILNKDITDKHQAFDMFASLRNQLEDAEARQKIAEDTLIECEDDINYLNLQINELLDAWPFLKEADGEDLSIYLPTGLLSAGYILILKVKDNKEQTMLMDKNHEVVKTWGYSPSLGELMEYSEAYKRER